MTDKTKTTKAALALMAACASLGLVLMGAAAGAYADTPAPYKVVAWKLGPASTPASLVAADITSPFADQQILVASADQQTLNLNALDGGLAPGACYQIDGYNAGATTDTLVAGAVLNAPNSPAEDLAYGAPGLSGNPWRYVCVPAVIPTPTPTPTPTEPPVVTPPPVEPPTTVPPQQLAETGESADSVRTKAFIGGLAGLAVIAGVAIGVTRLVRRRWPS